mgnify:FL=1|tara:strand:- start:9 stop:650 length:642 start_codon:yes stop_codon:yes gene_type:complete
MIFDLNAVQDVSGTKITGSIHIGAFVGEELEQYRGLGLFNTMLFEPQKKLYDIVRQRCILNEVVFNVALGSRRQTVEMFISDRAGGVDQGAGASSSILEPKKHLSEHPEVTFPEKEVVEVHRFDDFAKGLNLELANYNLLNIDVQGYELEVLLGAEKLLPQIEMIIAEVNRDEMYAGCPMIEDIDSFLTEHGFKREHTSWQSPSWGDALYIKK